MKPGIYDIPAADYHADPCEQPSLSASLARIICAESPLHAYTNHPRLNPDYEKREDVKFDVGTVSHALLLQGEDIVEVIDAADWRTNAAKDARDAARKSGKVPLLTHQWREAIQMVQAARIQLGGFERPLLRDGKAEQTLIWTEGDVNCRARVDWLTDDGVLILDYKTTSRSANPQTWSRTLYSMGYEVQCAMYRRGVRALTGKDAEFLLIVQETSAPYALSVLGLTPGGLQVGDTKVDYAIRTWRECLRTNVWPGWPQQVAYAELPTWEETAWLEKEAREEVAA